MSTSGIYFGQVAHTRLRPRQHRLRYRVFSLLLDITAPAETELRLFRRNRPAILSFWDRDHGDGTSDLVAWIRTRLTEAGLDGDGGRIQALCYPRLFGYVFNPLTVYFCHDRQERLQAILYEVSNTLGERHTYIAPVRHGDINALSGVISQRCQKTFYVSPFIPMDCIYDFQVAPPDERVRVSIFEHDKVGLLLSASFSGERRPLTDANLLKALLRYPLMTMKVTAGIYWEAAQLVRKRIPWFPHPPSPQRYSHGLARAPEPDKGRSP